MAGGGKSSDHYYHLLLREALLGNAHQNHYGLVILAHHGSDRALPHRLVVRSLLACRPHHGPDLTGLLLSVRLGVLSHHGIHGGVALRAGLRSHHGLDRSHALVVAIGFYRSIAVRHGTQH